MARRGTHPDRGATGLGFENLLGMSLERVIPGSLYRVAWREKLRHSGRMDPLSGNRENPHTDYQVDLVIVRGVEFQPGDTAEEVPLVAIEAKTAATTDNIIAAAKKADDIRAAYPWLRFGFVENAPYLTEKSLWHGRAFDFILCVKSLSDSELDTRLGTTTLRELEKAEMGIEVIAGSHRAHREYPAPPIRPLKERLQKIRPSGLRD